MRLKALGSMFVVLFAVSVTAFSPASALDMMPVPNVDAPLAGPHTPVPGSMTADDKQAPNAPAGQTASPADPKLGPAHPEITPEMLEAVYKYVWHNVASNFTDVEKLRRNWAGWEHKYDGKIKTVDELDAALKAMIESLGDRYTSYTSLKEMFTAYQEHEGGIHQIGMGLKKRGYAYYIEAIFYGSPVHKSVLREGDMIKSINGTTINSLSQGEVDALLKGKDGTKLTVVAYIDGQDQTVELTMAETPEAQVEAGILPGNIAYVRLPNFLSKQHVANLAQAMLAIYAQTQGNIQGIVFDLRNNMGGDVQLALAVASFFMEEGVIVKSTTRSDRLVTRTTFEVIPGLPWQIAKMNPLQAGVNELVKKAPLVVLVNGSTASSAEIVTGALKDNKRAIVLGTTTFGKGVAYTPEQLPSGYIQTTIMSYLTPNGTDLSGVGLKPDMELALPRVEVPAGELDAQLTAAVEHIQKLLKLQAEQLKDVQVIAVRPLAVPANNSGFFSGSMFYYGLGTLLLVVVILLVFVVRRQRTRS
jgi:carboxyl-terminal processing protease